MEILSMIKEQTHPLLPPDTSKEITIPRKAYDALCMYKEQAEGIVVWAYDENGEEFPKYVKPRPRAKHEREDQYILSFGWPVEYYIDDIAEKFPIEEDWCIDAGGRNHKGSPVYIKARTMNRLLAIYRNRICDEDLRRRVSKDIGKHLLRKYGDDS